MEKSLVVDGRQTTISRAHFSFVEQLKTMSFTVASSDEIYSSHLASGKIKLTLKTRVARGQVVIRCIATLLKYFTFEQRVSE